VQILLQRMALMLSILTVHQSPELRRGRCGIDLGYLGEPWGLPQRGKILSFESVAVLPFNG
jgi:hypothetical protein